MIFSCFVGSLYNCRFTVKECKGPVHVAGSSHSQQTYHGACSLKSAVQGRGRRLDQSEYRPMAEVSSPVCVISANTKEKGPLLAGKTAANYLAKVVNFS